MKKTGVIGIIAVVLLVTVGAWAETSFEETIYTAEDGHKGEMLNLKCYAKDLKSILEITVDLEAKKVLQPDYIKWGKVLTFKNSDEVRLVLYIPDKAGNKFLSIYGADGRMNVCKHDYESQSCEIFQCYRYDVPLFKIPE